MKGSHAALLVMATVALAACTEAERPERTDRERDSLIAESLLPGAQGVGGALRAQDTASARIRMLDSIARANP